MKENKKDYYIFLGDSKVDVSEKVYKDIGKKPIERIILIG